jgi:hypothetical protein
MTRQLLYQDIDFSKISIQILSGPNNNNSNDNPSKKHKYLLTYNKSQNNKLLIQNSKLTSYYINHVLNNMITFTILNINLNDPNNIKFSNFINKLDEYLLSPPIKQILCGENYEKYTYIPCNINNYASMQFTEQNRETIIYKRCSINYTQKKIENISKEKKFKFINSSKYMKILFDLQVIVTSYDCYISQLNKFTYKCIPRLVKVEYNNFDEQTFDVFNRGLEMKREIFIMLLIKKHNKLLEQIPRRLFKHLLINLL